MSKSDKLVPKLRFPEFENDWKKVKLKDVSTYFNGKSFEGNVQEEGKYELITLKSIDANGNLVHSKRYINDEVPTLSKGTLVMILSEQAPGLLGMTAIIPLDNKFVLNQRVAEIRPNDKVESFFLSMAINRNQRIFSRLGAGMKVQNISKPNVENYEFYYPILPEQKKIANCLSSLDNLITAETEKLDLLKVHKKGLLQQLFPTEGETQPKFRFPEFKDDGDWEETVLENCLDYLQPTGYLVSSTEYDDKYETPVLTAGKTFILGYTDEKEGIFYENLPVIIFDDFTTASKFVDFAFKAKSSAMKILLAKNDNDIKFMFEAIQNLKFEVSTHKRHWISVYSKLNILKPRDPKEQQKIAACLSAVDELLEAQEKKIEQLQEHKKGLLQQLFPTINELAI
jgi:type I restriction enzyme S subunit